jgi:hypothetical protein
VNRTPPPLFWRSVIGQATWRLFTAKSTLNRRNPFVCQPNPDVAVWRIRSSDVQIHHLILPVHVFAAQLGGVAFVASKCQQS